MLILLHAGPIVKKRLYKNKSGLPLAEALHDPADGFLFFAALAVSRLSNRILQAEASFCDSAAELPEKAEADPARMKGKGFPV